MKKSINYLIKNLFFVFLIFLTLSAVFALFNQTPEEPKEISLSQLANDISEEKVKELIVSEGEIIITYLDNTQAKTRKETEIALSDALSNYGVSAEKIIKANIQVKPEETWPYWLSTFAIFILPLIIFIIFFWLIFRQARSGAMQAMSFSKARARLFGADGYPKEKVTFKDVAGLKEAKQELEEIVGFLKNPKKFLDMGARIPRGVLLMGLPGTGKTLLARAIAGEANVPFFSISASELIELFVGVGAARTRDLFATAKKAGKAIIFIDELDAIGRVRGTGIGGGHDEREQTLNQILVEMDGFERDDTRIVIAATNRPDVLDPALLRPGRFDRKVILDLPDVNDRKEILNVHCREKPLSSNLDLKEIAERTPGFSGADLANVANEAAILAARKNKNKVSQEEFLESIEKVLLGPERKSHILSEKEKKITAYHEAGHALASALLPESEPVRKISIVARGQAAGYTLKIPSEEKKIKTKSEFLAELAVLLSGYTAEKLKFKEISTGAANDLERASALARKLVKEYGMSPLGPVSFGDKEELVFLGKEISEQRNYSEKIAAVIDEEVAKFIKEAQNKSQKLLIRKKKLLEKIAKRLITKETIEKEEFEKMIRLKKKKGA